MKHFVCKSKFASLQPAISNEKAILKESLSVAHKIEIYTFFHEFWVTRIYHGSQNMGTEWHFGVKSKKINKRREHQQSITRIYCHRNH